MATLWAILAGEAIAAVPIAAAACLVYIVTTIRGIGDGVQ